PERNGFTAVQNFIERLISDVAGYRMKETRPHRPIGFYNGRYPRCIALLKWKGIQAMQRTVITMNFADFFRRFSYKMIVKFCFVIFYQPCNNTIHNWQVFA